MTFNSIKFFLLSLFILFITALVFALSFIYVQKNHKLNLKNSLKNINLVTHNNTDINKIELTGDASLLFFGFTHCPEVCPTTLSSIINATDDLNFKNKNIKIIFVSLDPKRDTPENLKDYISGFDSDIIGITGDNEEISKFAKKWNIYWEKTNNSDDDYNINHTASVFMLDRDGDFSGTISWGENRKIIIEKIINLLN